MKMNRNCSSMLSKICLCVLLVITLSTEIMASKYLSINLQSSSIIRKKSIMERPSPSHRAIRQDKAAPLIYGSVGKCASMPSKAGKFCNSNYMIPEVSSTIADGMAHEINQSFVMIFASDPTASCRSKILNIACRTAFPVCNENLQTVRFDANYEECMSAVNECPTTIKMIMQAQRYCDVSIGQTLKLGTCVKPKVTQLRSCPKGQAEILVPDWLSNDLQFQDDTITFVKASLLASNVTQDCIDQIGNFQCTGQPFCSNNNRTVISYGSKQRCLRTMECLPAKMRNSASTLGFCGLFIDETKAQVYNSGCGQMNFQIQLLCSICAMVAWLFH